MKFIPTGINIAITTLAVVLLIELSQLFGLGPVHFAGGFNGGLFNLACYGGASFLLGREVFKVRMQMPGQPTSIIKGELLRLTTFAYVPLIAWVNAAVYYLGFASNVTLALSLAALLFVVVNIAFAKSTIREQAH